MPIRLQLDCHDGLVSAHLDGALLGASTALAALPDLAAVQDDPAGAGARLYQALGGADLLARLNADPERLLLLDIRSPELEAVPWEFAGLRPGRLLAARFGLLRLVSQAAPAAPAPAAPAPAAPAPAGGLRLLVLGADPLVYAGEHAPKYTLDIATEINAMRQALLAGERALTARRIPPTKPSLQQALYTGSGGVLLHLSCHGDVIANTAHGDLALLIFEDDDGNAAPLRGDDLAEMAAAGVLRLVVLSSCRTAVGLGEARLAHTLVRNGLPAVLGMQGLFYDQAADDFAGIFYTALLNGQPLGEALRAARQRLQDTDPTMAGLPVAYVAEGAWLPLDLPAGTPHLRLAPPGACTLPPEITPPTPLLGRNYDLHALAQLYSNSARVVTIAGSAGIGKTALAGSFARRFSWRWPQGVAGISFASGTLDLAAYEDALLRTFGRASAALAEAPSTDRQQAILSAVPQWDGLLLLDNYEAVSEAPSGQDDAGETIHRLSSRLADAGLRLLLTSRHQPAQLRGEVLYPSGRSLPGLATAPGAELFLSHSQRAREQGQTGVDLAAAIAARTAGHPLALTLLGGAYQAALAESPAAFLEHWDNALNDARNQGLSEHHVTLAAAFERSYATLSPDLQTRLRRLSNFDIPFYAAAAVFAWADLDDPTLADLPLETGPRADAIDRRTDETFDQCLPQAEPHLAALVQRSLLEVDGYDGDGTPDGYRFQPALRQALLRRSATDLPSDTVDEAARRAAWLVYGQWLAVKGYDEIHKEPAVAQRVRQSLPALEAAARHLSGLARLRHIQRLAWLLKSYGLTQAAETWLAQVEAGPDEVEDNDWRKVRASLLLEQANLSVTRGDLGQAMDLYQRSLEIKEQVDDRQGLSATLHQMARVWVTRGDLAQAMALYQRSLEIKEQVGDRQGQAATLGQMAEVWMRRSDLTQAMELLQRSLQILEQVGDHRGQAAIMHNMAYIAVERGDLAQAMALYQRSLEINEQVGDLIGQADTLSQMSNIFWEQGDLEQAQAYLQDSLAIGRELGDAKNLAYNTLKAGQLSQRRGDAAQALALYQEALALFERIGAAPMVSDVQQLIAELQAGPSSSEDPVAQALAAAKQAAQAGDFAAAVQHQGQAVAAHSQMLQQAGVDPNAAKLSVQARQGLVTLSVLLYNQASFLLDAGQPAEAVPLLEAVVALDERTAHPDLESDRQALATARQMAAGGAAMLAQTGSPAEDTEQAAARAWYESLPPEQQQAVAIQGLVQHAAQLTAAARSGQADPVKAAQTLEQQAAQMADGAAPGSPWLPAAALLRAFSAHLRGQPASPPDGYVEVWAAVMQAGEG